MKGMPGLKAFLPVTLLLLIGLYSCNQPVEGCLDINSANYDVDADQPCPDCCEYPLNRLDLEHKVVNGDVTSNLEFDSLKYFDAAGTKIGVLELKYYLSDMHLLRDNGEVVISTDTIGLKFPQSPGDTLVEIVEDNFAIADPSNFRQRLMGHLRADGQFKQISILLGLEDPANSADPAYIQEDHPLADKEMYDPDAGSHLFTRLELFTIGGANDTIRTLLEIEGEQNLRELVFPASFYLDPGFSPRLLLQVDYQKWFDVLDVQGSTVDEMEARLVEQIPTSISFVSITTDLD